MKSRKISRRNFVQNSFAGMGTLALPNIFQQSPQSPFKALRIVCVGGHPDDPESGCGGTLARMVDLGHSVTILYLTRGEAGIPGKSHDESAAIRSKEAEAACRILKAKPVFAGQIDGDTVVSSEWITKLQQLLEAESPDIVFTQWPVDTHKDHQAASLLTQQAYFRLKRAFSLYFYEVCNGEQTQIFRPTDYVDITATQARKKESVYCHVSQDPPGIYNCGHAAMEEFRGREIGVKAAEAFVKMNPINSSIS